MPRLRCISTMVRLQIDGIVKNVLSSPGGGNTLCHLEAEVSPVVFCSLKTILIRALLSTSYVDSFDRKLLDSDL